MKKILAIAAIAICFGMTSDAFAQKGKPSPTPNVFVTAKFEPVGTSGANKVLMDNYNAPYTHNVDGVLAQFQLGDGTGNLTINIRNSVRQVVFDLSDIANSTPTSSQHGWTSTPQYFNPGMNIHEAYKAKTGCQPVDGVYNCNFPTTMVAVNLSVTGYNFAYRLLWNPNPSTDTPVNSPEPTSKVSVNYYKGHDSDNKEVFTITPLPNEGASASGRIIAGLEATSTAKGKTSRTNAGQYIMPFTLTVRPLP